jgi:hypothetical protein
MCDDIIKSGLFKDENECTSGEDYVEAAQGACEDTLGNRVQAYNAKHAGSKMECEN